MYRNLNNLLTNLTFSFFFLLLVWCSRTFTKISTIRKKERVKKSGRKHVFKKCEETEWKKSIDVACNNRFSPTLFEIKVSLAIYCTISTKSLHILKKTAALRFV